MKLLAGAPPATSRWWATTTRPSTAGAARPLPTSSASDRTLPGRARGRADARTTARPRPCSTRPTGSIRLQQSRPARGRAADRQAAVRVGPTSRGRAARRAPALRHRLGGGRRAWPRMIAEHLRAGPAPARLRDPGAGQQRRRPVPARAQPARRSRGPFSGNRGLYGASPRCGCCSRSCARVAHPDDSVSLTTWRRPTSTRCPIVDLTARSTLRATASTRPLFDVLRERAANESWPASRGAARAAVRAAGRRPRARDMELAARAAPASSSTSSCVDSGLLARLRRRPRAEREQEVQNVASSSRRARRLRRVRRVRQRARVRQPPRRAARGRATIPRWPRPTPTTPAVHVLTVHKAKGLEFPVVFLVDCVQNRFPCTGAAEPLELPPARSRTRSPSRRLPPAGGAAAVLRGDDARQGRAATSRSAADYGGRRDAQGEPVRAGGARPAADAARPFRAQARSRSSRATRPRRRAGGGDAGAACPTTSRSRLSHRQVDDYQTCPLKYQLHAHAARAAPGSTTRSSTAARSTTRSSST